jgi:hypothetical protein
VPITTPAACVLAWRESLELARGLEELATWPSASMRARSSADRRAPVSVMPSVRNLLGDPVGVAERHTEHATSPLRAPAACRT